MTMSTGFSGNRQAADAGGAVFTLFRATYPISKRFKLNGSGLEKFAALPLGKGTAHLIRIASLDDLADFLDGLGMKDAVGFGIPRCLADKPGAAFVGITTKEKANGAACIPRLKETFIHPEWLAVWWGDIDRAKGQDEVPDAAEIDATLCALLPWWSGIDRLYRPSVSAHISHGGKRLSGRTGMRVYAFIDKGVNSEAVHAIVADALWKGGHGRIEHSKDGKRNVRSLFDLSKASPESLDYAGKPVFETPGLVKDHVAPVFFGPSGAVIDSGKVIAAAGIGRLTVSGWRKQSVEVQAALEAALPEEKRLRKAYVETKSAGDVSRAKEAAAARGESFDEDAARKRSRELWSRAAHDTLTPDFVIELQDGSRVTVVEILANIGRFDLQYCRDPIEPGYNGGQASVAQIHAHDKPHIWSFAHGGRYYSLEDRRPEPRLVNGSGGADAGNGHGGGHEAGTRDVGGAHGLGDGADGGDARARANGAVANEPGEDRAQPAANGKPLLRIEHANPELTLGALRGLLAGTGKLFERGGAVAGLASDQTLGGVMAYDIAPENIVILAHEISRPWMRKNVFGEWKNVDSQLPRAMAQMYLKWRGQWRLPVLNGITSAPLLSADGGIRSVAGYDSASGLWCENVPDIG